MRPTEVADMKAYLMSSFYEHDHPLYELVDGLVKAFAFSFGILGSNRLLLTDAIKEVVSSRHPKTCFLCHYSSNPFCGASTML